MKIKIPSMNFTFKIFLSKNSFEIFAYFTYFKVNEIFFTFYFLQNFKICLKKNLNKSIDDLIFLKSLTKHPIQYNATSF